MAARSCCELGLHQRESLEKSFTNAENMEAGVRLFWISYALDRRWSFGTGMPFAIQDADIDWTLPEPVSLISTRADMDLIAL